MTPPPSFATAAPSCATLPTRGREVLEPTLQSSPSPLWGGIKGGGGHSRDVSNRSMTYPHLSPPSPPVRYCSPSAAPKRDHDEWLVQQRSGGAGVASHQAETMTVRPTGTGKPLLTRGGALPALPRIESCRARAAGGKQQGGPHRVAGAENPSVSRCGTGCSRALRGIGPKPRSAGEARASHILRTTRVGAHASPAPLRSFNEGTVL